LELVEPADQKSPVISFLKQGGGLHHICHQVASVQTELDKCWSSGGVVAKEPLPAVAFGGRLIGWVYTADGLLIEYLER
jgi:methylmalonyl-CoA/ethylmalonyl-CoA epimerase